MGLLKRSLGLRRRRAQLQVIPLRRWQKPINFQKRLRSRGRPLYRPTHTCSTLYLILTANRPANTKSSSDAVLGYLEKTLGSGDYVAIFYIDQGLHLAQPFTNDLQKARETLKRIETRRTTGASSGSDPGTTQ